jgi:hypothetical protein
MGIAKKYNHNIIRSNISLLSKRTNLLLRCKTSSLPVHTQLPGKKKKQEERVPKQI